MKNQAIKNIKGDLFKQEDTLVIFGEQFPGGYINGLIQAAKNKKMNIIYSTVGRRSKDGKLRKLDEIEVKQQAQPLINVPLEAGFDMEESDSGLKPIDECNKIGLKEWETATLNKIQLESARKNSIESFRNRTKQWVKKLLNILPDKGDVLIAHTMAGGVPRSRIFFPILNRVLKGTQSRFFSSEKFWQTDLGWLCQNNFNEVTAQTYQHLIELTTPLAEKLKKQNRKIFYTGYSYHGTEVLVNDQYQWQSYAPYLQGFAKIELENISKKFFEEGINSCVFNVPEILTKSSAVFPGVEIPLYTILGAFQKESGPRGQIIISHCMEKLKIKKLNDIMNVTKQYFESPAIQKQSFFKHWPQHNTLEHMNFMLETSTKLSSLNKNKSDTITPYLSKIVMNSCAHLILQEFKPKDNNIKNLEQAVNWIGHNIIARDVGKNN